MIFRETGLDGAFLVPGKLVQATIARDDNPLV